ncbi:MAG: sigma-54-dependent Fis family transcriptional regulator, partial [Bacteroidetes bacterium]
MSSILVIEDERSIRNTLKDIFDNEGYETDLAEDGQQGIEKIEKNDYNLIFTDIKMPKMDGIEVLEKAKELKPDIPIIMISGHGDIDTAVECIKKGAFDFIQKPLDLNRMLITIRNATDKTQLIKQTKVLKKRINKKYQMVGESPAIMQIKDMIDKVAETNARILITGENGTGKEVVAHWIHEKSERSSAPFIEVNCAAIPSELI